MTTAIVLAGGKGTRLSPLTTYTSKQLLPIYDKPTIFYPVKLLELSGITHLIMVINEHHLQQFKSLFATLELNFSYEFVLQDEPKGLPHGVAVALQNAKATVSQNFLVMLGDNFLHGAGLPRLISESLDVTGCCIFLKSVKKPESYGVAVLEGDSISNIVEKPQIFISNLAITGLYKFDMSFLEKFSNIRISQRNEYEIVDILKAYKNRNALSYQLLGQGVSWFDTGTFDDLLAVAEFVRSSQERTGDLIGQL